MDFENWLETLADEGGSDLCLTTGAPPSAKFDGELKSLSDERLSPGFTRDLAYELMDGQQAREFDEKLEMNLAISLSGICLLYTSPSPRDAIPSRMPSSA